MGAGFNCGALTGNGAGPESWVLQVSPPPLWVPGRARHCVGSRGSAFVPGWGEAATAPCTPWSIVFPACATGAAVAPGRVDTGIPGAPWEMKLPKPWWAGGGLLHLTILLSLVGLRVDLDLCLPPPAAALWEELLPLCPTRPASASSPFSASEGRGRIPLLPAKSRLLHEVRALGVPFIPHTRVDAWLVHSVATGNADGAHGLLGTAASSAVGDGGQSASAGGGDPRAAHSSPLAAEEEEEKAAEPTAQVPDAGGCGSQVT